MEVCLVSIASVAALIAVGILCYRGANVGGKPQSSHINSPSSSLKNFFFCIVSRLSSYSFIEKLYQALELDAVFEKLSWALHARFLKLKAEELGAYECFSAYLICSTLSALAAYVAVSSVISCLISQFVLAIATYQLYGKQKKRYMKELHEALPELYRSLSSALSSGKSLQQACAYVGKRGNPFIAEAFSEAAYKMQTGTPYIIAIEELEFRLQIPSIELIGSALTISQRTGCALKSLFEKASVVVLRSSELKRELQVKTSQAQLSSKIVSGLPLILLALMALVSPDFRAGIFTPIGLSCITLGLALDLIGLVIIRAYLRLEV